MISFDSIYENIIAEIVVFLLSLFLSKFLPTLYNNQCPACKRFIKAKKRIDEKIIKEFIKEIPYQPMKVWKYSNGKIKKKEPFGDKKTRTEKWQTKQEFYECNHSKHQWDSGHVDTPVFIENESHKVISTNEKDPDEPSIY